MSRTSRRRLAVVRPVAPNFAELAPYASLLEDFDITLFYGGPPEPAARAELAALGLHAVRVCRYRALTDAVPRGALRRALDYRLGLASYMLGTVEDVLAHDVINIVDPVYAFAGQLVHRLRPSHRLVVVRWELIPGRYDTGLGVERRARAVLARADAVVCASEAARQSLATEPPVRPNAVIEVVHPAVTLPAPPAERRSGGLRVVTVARLQWQKGVDDLLGALAILRREHGVAATLRVFGGGDTLRWARLAARYGVGAAVEFAGARSNAEVRRALAEADVYCQPSAASRTWCEQFGFAVVEAMAHGCPVVVASSGVLPEIVGPDGYYAATRNAADLARALAEALADPAAPARGIRLAARARSRFAPETQGARLRALYARV